MGTSGVLGVIPARIGSERLPDKPLYPLAGRPLIEWVWRRVRECVVLDAVVVATDSERVAEACADAGADIELTSPAHASGTERVAEVASMPRYRDFGVIVNVQGDEPFITDEQIAGPVRLVRGGRDVGTAAVPIGSLDAWRDPAVVKVVRGDDGDALYFSRAPIPHRRGGDPAPDDLASERYLRHVGVYAYTAEALARWVDLPAGELEATERLEQLRALAAGLDIGIAIIEHDGAGIHGIDTPEQARRAEERLKRAHVTGASG